MIGSAPTPVDEFDLWEATAFDGPVGLWASPGVSPEEESAVKSGALEHIEFMRRELRRPLCRKYSLFLFTSKAECARHVRLSPPFALPEAGFVFLNVNAGIRAQLEHEMNHVIAAEIFGPTPHVFLQEGFAALYEISRPPVSFSELGPCNGDRVHQWLDRCDTYETYGKSRFPYMTAALFTKFILWSWGPASFLKAWKTPGPLTAAVSASAGTDAEDLCSLFVRFFREQTGSKEGTRV